MASRKADWPHREGADSEPSTRASDKTQHRRRRDLRFDQLPPEKIDRCGYARAQRLAALLLAAVLPRPERRAALPAGRRRGCAGSSGSGCWRPSICRGRCWRDGCCRRRRTRLTLRQSLRPQFGRFTRQFELGSRREVLHVVGLPVGAGKGLASHVDLATSGANRHQAEAQQYELPACGSRIHHAHRESPNCHVSGRSRPLLASSLGMVKTVGSRTMGGCRSPAVWFPA